MRTRTQPRDRRSRALALAIVHEVAEVQHGVVLRDQALEAGLSPSAISRLVAGGTWARVAPRAYLVVALRDDRSRLSAVTLAYPGAAASHRAGALLHGYDGVEWDLVEVSVPRGVRPVRCTYHQVDDLARSDVMVVDGIPVTNPTRTLCDVGAVVDADALELMLESALRRRLTTAHRLRRRAEALARPGRRGPAALLEVLDRRPPDAPPTESWLEATFAQLLRAHGVDEGVAQHEVRDGSGRLVARLDRCWPDVRLYAELNGRAFHGFLQAGRDRWRQNTLTELGWRPLQFDYDDVTRHPRRTARSVAATLAAARSTTTG